MTENYADLSQTYSFFRSALYMVIASIALLAQTALADLITPVGVIASGHMSDPLKSVRTLVELHQQKPQCASCHARFDFIGLGLENFGPVGLWRDQEIVTNSQNLLEDPRAPKKIYPVDASGELPNGETFRDVHGLKKALMKQERQVAGSLLEGLLCYALGRDVSFTDREIVETNLDELAEPNASGETFRVREMIKRVVASRPFRER